MGFKPRHIGCGFVAACLILTVFGIQSVYSKAAKDSSDITFDDLQPVKSDDSLLSTKLVSKRSIIDELDDESDELNELDELLEIENANDAAYENADDHWLTKGINRIKRSLNSIIGGDEATHQQPPKKSKRKHKKANEKLVATKNSTRTNRRKKNTQTANPGDHIVQKPKKKQTKKENPEKKSLQLKKLDNPRRRRQQHDILSDDEDDLNGSGSGEEDMSGEVPHFYRLKITVAEIWNNNFRNPGSDETHSFNAEFTEGLIEYISQTLHFKSIISANVVNIAQRDRIGIYVTVDLEFLDTVNIADFTNRFKRSIDESPRIGSYTVDGTNLVVSQVREKVAVDEDQIYTRTPIGNPYSQEHVTQINEETEHPIDFGKYKPWPERNTTVQETDGTDGEYDELPGTDDEYSVITYTTDGEVEEDLESDDEETPSSRETDEEILETRFSAPSGNAEQSAVQNEIEKIHPHINLLDSERPVECPQGEKLCKSGTMCYPISNDCDEFPDCDDGSDEENCTKPTEVKTNETELICNDDEFKCIQGSDYVCLPSDFICDSIPQCDNGEDEQQNCDRVEEEEDDDPEIECREEEYACHDGVQCVPKTQQCNRELDCNDGSDELNCPEPEQETTVTEEPPPPKIDLPVKEVPTDRCDDTIRCGDSDVFICGIQKCDGNPDCPYGEDEQNCPNEGDEENKPAGCEANEFECDGNKCLPHDLKCDNQRDCEDGTDEESCPPPSIECGSDEYLCSREQKCISRDLYCDGHQDCHGGDDEDNCECNPQQFRCDSGRCIESHYRCDGKPDCDDGSDESDAECGACSKSEWQCDYGTCIPIEKLCDGNIDCPEDISDERSCNQTCEPNEFSCDNTCFGSNILCDGIVDCIDGTDEKSCPGTPQEKCDDYEFQCKNGLCISSEDRCNGHVDCLDKSDEQNCTSCIVGAFHCDSDECIPENKRCDSQQDCLDLSDEINCKYRCKFDEFRCSTNDICLNKRYLCDGIKNCLDGSDEFTENCDNSEAPESPILKPSDGICELGLWRCENGVCINEEFECDGNIDCIDESDEKYCKPNTEYECSGDEFLCDGKCFSFSHQCDGRYDCLDGSDENPRVCTPPQPPVTQPPPDDCYELTCKYTRQCYSHFQHCDGRLDCSDGSDEENCLLTGSCKTSEFSCSDGKMCVDGTMRCDNFYDCKDFSDEQNCLAKPCDGYLCSDGQCIDKSQQCDRQNDCRDGGDEQNCPDPECRDDEFKCTNGDCIRGSDLCNGRYDCSDYSDEENCPPATPKPPSCESSEWQCSDGQCISNTEHCNGYADCYDQSDEQGCPHEHETDPACPPNMFRCENDPCIPISLRCNGFVDCPYDISDELDCPNQESTRPPPIVPQGGLNLKTYPSQQIIKERREVVFQCRDEGPLRAKVRWTRSRGRPLPPGSIDRNGRLEIPNIQIEHDGEYVCEATGFAPQTPGSKVSVQLTVEKYSIPTRPPVCGFNEATCANGQCIAKSKVCDDHHDCSDGSDETRCSKHNRCEPNEFKCNNGKCVFKTWRCDGENDCIDNSDESDCGTSSPEAQCRVDEHQCTNGQCIPKAYVCDAHNDCSDNSDEHGCQEPNVIKPPPPLVKLNPGDTFNITCRAVGFPMPLITWRLNWGHIPDDCTTSSHNGFGVLTCSNIQVKHSGAYSCEAINSKGSIIAVPDTILIVNDGQVCPSGLFNVQANTVDECIQCFCFGVASQCKSADLFVYELPPPVRSLNLAGVKFQPEISIGSFSKSDLIPTQHGIQLRYSNLPVTGEQPYYSLPSDYSGNQLKSYGGSLRYEVIYVGRGDDVNSPDIIISGNKQILTFKNRTRILPNQRNKIVAPLSPDGGWRTIEGRPASRQQIMMTLANVDNILIKLQYVNAVQRETELLHIVMDSAGTTDMGLGSAHLVEECNCPEGHIGLSCESCAPGYVRQQEGSWLGRCVPERRECSDGTYGDPARGIECRPCPCPVNTQFSATCHLGSDNEVVCSCPSGYVGRRCESCASGYEGNPIRGIPCRPVAPSTCNPYGTEETYPDGRCKCKNNVVGEKCDKCAPNSFAFNSRSPTVCMNCFCMGVSRQCTSSSYYRESVFLSYSNPRAPALSVISSYERQDPDFIESNRVSVSNNELSVSGFSPSDTVPYYWSLSSAFIGNKITAYGGNLTYSVRFTSHPGGFMSRNNAPDVVIKSLNDIELVHYREDTQSSSGFQTVTIPMIEDLWQRLDGKDVSRPHFLMALADIEAIYIKATYTTITEDAALQDVSLDIASARNTGSSVQAIEVEDCTCPEGHIGLSCEDCARGYTRSADSGIYLGSCEPCECNKHSQDCHPENGVCENCRHNTRGEHCEQCDDGFSGNATLGTPVDCKPETIVQCKETCNINGGYCANDECVCKSNVQGSRCDECREGSFNLDRSNPNGCTECYCSGATRQCSTANLYREEIPMIIFEDKFKLTKWDNSEKLDGNIKVAEFNNEVSYQFENYQKSQKWYWNLPSRFLGNQVLSYGGNLTITQKTQGYSPSRDVQNVILKGNGVTLVWENNQFVDDTYSIVLYEQYWRNYQRVGIHTVTRSDLLNVLSNLDSILVLASKYEETEAAYLSDIILDTAVSHQTNKQKAVNIEECYCPRGYHGTSCESCDNLYYRDLSGSCRACPCDETTTTSCSLTSENRVQCVCRSGYYGRECRDTEPDEGPEPPRKPNITVTISQPTLKIFEVGETARVTCSGEHRHQMPVLIHWVKLDGAFSVRAYVEKGTLLISNLQEDDSGVYECRAAVGTETAGAQVTITVAVPQRPVVTFVPQYVQAKEYESAEVECQVSGSPKPVITWERLNGDMPRNAVIRDNVLRFNSIRKSDEGDYRCFAQNSLGSDDQILRVYVQTSAEPTEQPPQIVFIEPETIQTKPGEEFELTCGNNPSESVVWSKAGATTLPENAYVDRNVLRVYNTQLFDSGTYICRINVNGRIEEAYATVIIETSSIFPEIKRLPESANIIQGADYSYNCEASGTPYPLIKWTMHHETFRPNVQQVGNTLHIYNAQINNRGIYSCVASNDEGTDESSIRIEIEPREPPKLEIYPNEPQIIRETESAMLSCRAIAGEPSPNVTWTRKDRLPISRRFREQYAGTLVLEDAKLEDSGEYICRAENIAGTVTLTTTIVIQRPPVITIYPNTTSVKLTIGDRLYLICNSEGIPTPSVYWESPDQPIRVASEAALPSADSLIRTSSEIQIPRVTKSDGGYYTCHAQNDAGRETQYVEVQVVERRGDIPSETGYEHERQDNQRPQRPDWPTHERPEEPEQPNWSNERDRPEHTNSSSDRGQPDRTTWGGGRERPNWSGRFDGGGDESPESGNLRPYTIVADERAKLSCEYEGPVPATKTYWRRADGAELPYSSTVDGGNLIIERTTVDAAGVYECIVENQYQAPFPAIRFELIVIEPPKITFYPQMPMHVQSGDNVNIVCETSGEQPIYVRWHKRDNEPLPSSVYANEHVLQFYHITPADQGTYLCTASNSKGNVTKVAQVIVNNNNVIDTEPHNEIQNVDVGATVSLDCNLPSTNDRGSRVQWSRQNGEIPRNSEYSRNRLIISDIRLNDAGIYVCEIYYGDGKVARNFVNVLVTSDPSASVLKLEPSISYLRPGDSFEVECVSTVGLDNVIIWEKEDGTRLPYNFRQIDNRLIMQDVQVDNEGKYVCKCEADGHLYTSEYELKIQNNQEQKRRPKIEYVEVGSNVDLQCQPDQFPSRYLWSRLNGALPQGQSYTNQHLNLTNVQARDAGTYVCSATHNGQTVDLPTILVVTNAIPHFPQAPKSFMTFEKIRDSYMRFSIEVTFRPERADGLILYNGERPNNGDYVALSLNDGYPEFRFDFGNQPLIVRAKNQVSLRDWHTIKINRIRKEGYMIVDNEPAVTFPPEIKFQGLDLMTNLYLGGVPSFDELPATAVAKHVGFIGCISRLIAGPDELELNKDSIYSEGTTSCEPCGDDPCANDGVCLEAQSERGYTCVCQDGFTGRNCQRQGESCKAQICGTGNCLDTDKGLQCLCPLNRTGDRCQVVEHLDESNISFKDGSYAAYKTPKSTKLNIKFKIRPNTIEDGVILYVAESLTSPGDFVSVTLKDGHIEFRILVGARVEPILVRSKDKIQANKWTEITIERKFGENTLKVGDEQALTVKHPQGATRNILLKSLLYIGGYDKRTYLHPHVGIDRGFNGCLSELEVASVNYDLVSQILDAANIQNCGQVIDENNTHCRPGYGGRNCDVVVDVCTAQNPCENDGICVSHESSYQCNCPLGFAGPQCQNWINIDVAGYFRGNGYIELNGTTISKTALQSTSGIAILFSTTHSDGLLVWNGQNSNEKYNGQDFISLGLVNGKLEFAFRLDGEEATIVSNEHVNNGKRHVAIIKRDRNNGSLELDQKIVTAESRPTGKQDAFIPGTVFVGGAPDVRFLTGDRYSEGFHGCVHIIEPLESGVIYLKHNAISAANVDQCPPNDIDDDDIDLGTDPPLA